MKFIETHIKDLIIIEPTIFLDDRGHFFEAYNKEIFLKNGIKYDFVQDNQSFSTYGVIRGLHFQKDEFAQAKLIRVLKGKVLDVAVDLRPDSKTYGKYLAIEISAENQKQLMIPKGFAHGFSVLSEEAIFVYKCDNYYNKNFEGGIVYNDSDLNIDWQIPAKNIKVSDKDLKLNLFKDVIDYGC